jgi:PBSX family phage terminase large subunit
VKFSPAQSQIYSDTHRFRVLVCGRKFGKTTLASEELGDCAFSRDGRRVIYIAPTLEDARRLLWDRLKRRFNNPVTKSNDTRLELTIPTQDGGRSTIFLGSWEKVDNYRGDEFDLEIFDEVQDYRNFWSGWLEAMRPTLTPRQGSALFMGTPKGFNHFYDLFNKDAKDKDFKSFHFTSYDNPHIPPAEIESARSQANFEQEYLAKFTKAEGLVYKEFSRDRHLYDELPQYEFEYVGAVDFGYTNPAAVLHVYYRAEGFWIDDEWYKRQRTDRQIAEYVAANKFKEVFPDPENAGGIEELRTAGCNVREVIKGKNSVVRGIQKIRELLLQGKLHINRRCLNLIHEFESYAYDDANEDKNQDENPLKKNDHALDALRYAVLMKEPETISTYRQPDYDPSEYEGAPAGQPGQGFAASGMSADAHGGKVDFGINRVVPAQKQKPYEPTEFESAA